MKKEKIELLARVTDTIRSIEALGFDTNDHLLFGVETDDSGRPSAKIFKTKSSPFMLLGMIEVAMRALEEAKAEVIEKLDKVDEMSKLVAKLPSDLADKIQSLERRMRKATSEDDLAEMKRIQDELDNLLESSRGSIIDFLKKERGLDTDSDDDNKKSDDDIDFSDLMGSI
jgi:predicted HTH transcriptional regulator